MFFLDNASTTPCFEESAKIVKNALISDYFNPSAKYNQALNMQLKLNECRKTILKAVGGINYDVIFTASATESNNLVISTAVSNHYTSLISVGEHSSVYASSMAKLQENKKVKFLKLNPNGSVDFEDFKNHMEKSVGFISMMIVSNETGAINDIKRFVAFARKVNPSVLFHVDAVQGFCKVDINIEDLGIDYLTISSHKVNGPKGVGALVVKKKCKLTPFVLGGGQENGIRSGTENLPAILGFANSVTMHLKSIKEDYLKVKCFKEEFYSRLSLYAKNEGVNIELNGSMEHTSPYILSVSFIGIRAEVLLHKLEEYEILVGTGSACNSNHSGNRVLEQQGKSKESVEGNIRFSFSLESTTYDADYLAKTIIDCVKNIKRK